MPIMVTSPSLSSRLRDAAIQEWRIGMKVRTLLFEAADALEVREPEPVRLPVTEIEVS